MAPNYKGDLQMSLKSEIWFIIFKPICAILQRNFYDSELKTTQIQRSLTLVTQINVMISVLRQSSEGFHKDIVLNKKRVLVNMC